MSIYLKLCVCLFISLVGSCKCMQNEIGISINLLSSAGHINI